MLSDARLSWKHLAAGQKRKWEWWEPIWYFGMYGGMALAALGLYFKPDTRYAPFHALAQYALFSGSIKTWALDEAKARMEARGEPTDYASYKAAKAS